MNLLRMLVKALINSFGSVLEFFRDAKLKNSPP